MMGKNDDDDRFSNDKLFRLCTEKLILSENSTKNQLQILDVLKTFVLPNFINFYFSENIHIYHIHTIE